MSQLDQIVKGAPPPEAPAPVSVSKTPSPPLPPLDTEQAPSSTALPIASVSPDPLSTLPSSPPQIYLNLLILESSLRSQYLALRARRRQNTFFLLLLGLWIAYFAYALFLRPREDGRGVGGSVYWVVEMGEKVALMGGVVTGILVWGTGQWERGVRWPRRWLAVANRGLRGMNAKIVVIRGPWWKELLSYISFIFPYSAFFPSSTSFHYVEYSSNPRDKRFLAAGRSPYEEDGDTAVEEDLASGGDHIKLLLLPKSFSPAFRENWDEYRTEYWERENDRRASLRRKLKERESHRAKVEGGWLWWTGWRGWKRSRASLFGGTTRGSDLEKPHHSHHHNHHLSRHSLEKDAAKNRRQGSPAHSRSSSRSTTPNLDIDDRLSPIDRDGRRARRSSTASASNGERKRKSKGSISGGARRSPSPLTAVDAR